MPDREEVARAIAFFQTSEDVAMLRKALVDVAPRARRIVFRYMGAGGDDTVPPPADIEASATAASREEALRTLASTSDFALLQAITRAIGRRVEEIEGESGGS